ncbi:sensor histidine kinase [Candidatus Nitrosacidococcus tergens]|uniref:histidine kinase n=1 Tax=Candidatus Nitrosacidococcus tergens TaxID=553981 RepID=A0A7G1Q904_9GAMM|nr:sensor histidine kinase [Candidatus Nitrosacidococcus tergens]CAB1275541.1 Integral membrane sensor signal transduction histidine kinase [Candidatus Nitrosacidococcus tergens]
MTQIRSLKLRLLLHLILPLTSLVIINSFISYYVTLYYVNSTYDDWLLDSAASLAQEIKSQEGKVAFNIPPAALRIFQWDNIDQTFFEIESQQLGFIAGDQFTSIISNKDFSLATPIYFDGEIHHKKIRGVTILTSPKDTSDKVLVMVAETLNKRKNTVKHIIFAVIIPEVLLIFIISFYMQFEIKRGLIPLYTLAQELSQRSPQDLTSISDVHVPSEIRIVIHTMNNLLAKLMKTIALQKAFIENAAHQLRTPLSGLKVQAERALRLNNLEEMKPALIQIKSSADQMNHLNSQLLILAQSETAKESSNKFLPVDLNHFIRETCIEWVPYALKHNIELSFDSPSSPILIQGRETLLRELLNNLIDNAIRYSNSQGRVWVTLKNTSQPSLIIEDEGYGIPRAELDKVFDRFYRISRAQKEGCGLGLAIVKEIADLHHIKIRIEQGKNSKGTEVTLIFNSL